MPTRLRQVALIAACSVAGLVLAPPPAVAFSPRDEPSEDKPTPPVDPEKGEQELFSLHFQATMVTAYHPKFAAKYSGENSLGTESESATALVSTLYFDHR